MNLHFLYQKAAALIREADGLLIAAGAGMGVDSGLPTFRDAEGLWKDYPALGDAKISLMEIAEPYNFQTRPALTWYFFAHLLQLFREILPHAGFQILQDMAADLAIDIFVLTSNIDGHFQKAGFASERVYEIHGSIHYMQCALPCRNPNDANVWPAEGFTPDINHAQGCLNSEMPVCPYCGSIARPNVLLFGDWDFSEERIEIQSMKFRKWRNNLQSPVVIELGAGVEIMSVRDAGKAMHCPVIRINPMHFEIAGTGVGIPTGALEGLLGIAAALKNNGGASNEP